MDAAALPSEVRTRPCYYDSARIARCAKRGEHIVFMGDSTHRALHDAFLRLLGERYGMDTLTVRPHLDGLPVKDRDLQKDTDTLAMHDPRGYHGAASADVG